MKRIILIASVLILLGGGISYAALTNSDTPQTSSDIYIETEGQNEDEEESENESESEVTSEDESEINDFPEHAVLNDVVDVDLNNAQIVKDNNNKRVILLNDDNNQEQFKSIYVKKKNRLKVIDFNGGLIFNEVLDQEDTVTSDKSEDEAVEEKEKPAEENTGSEDLEEYKKIANHVDINEFNIETVEDNPYKRVIILNDNNGKSQYKSIYIKNKNRLKIIDFHGGLLYNGKI